MSDLITERLERERDIKENSVRLRLSNKERNLIELRAKEG
jgi:hypothetical protein